MPVTALQAGTDVLDRAVALLSLDGPSAPETVRADVRRQAWAMGSAAIDTYMHWRVRSVALDGDLSKPLERLEIPLAALIETGKKSVEARRQGVRDRPLVRARNALVNRILGDTYQTERGVENAMALAGATKYWEPVSKALNETPRAVKSHLNALAHRRNKIVHEGDILRKSRPRRIQHEELDRAEVLRELTWIRAFLIAMDQHAVP